MHGAVRPHRSRTCWVKEHGRARGRHRLRHGSVRPRHDRPAARALPDAARRRSRPTRAAPRRIAAAARGRASARCRGWNATDAPFRTSSRPRARSSAGGRDARRRRGRVRRRDADLRELDARANQLAHTCARWASGREAWSVSASSARSTMLVGAARRCSRRAARTSRWTPRFPAERLAFMVEDARSRRAAHAAMHSRRSCPPHAASVGLRRRPRSPTPRPLGADAGSSDPGERGPRRPPPTSSTPRARPASPRACVVPHGAVVNFLRRCQEPGLAAGRRAARGHHAVVRHRGARALLAARRWARASCSSRARRPATAIGSRCFYARARATAMQATPATWRLLLAAGLREGA